MESFLQDLRYGLRALRRSPGLAVVAIVSLGLGIGAVTTAYTWTDRFVIHPLPLVEGTGRMVVVNTRAPGGDEWSVSIAAFREWREQNHTTDLAASAFAQVGLRKGEGTERAWGLAVSSNLASVLGVQPALGRWISLEEERSPAPVVVLDHDLWVREFGGDSALVGRSITLNGTPMTVIGIMPAGFAGDQVGLHFDLYLPIGIRHVLLRNTDPTPYRGWQFLNVTGRIRPGYTLAQAREDLDATAKRASVAAGSDVDRLGAIVKPFAQNHAARFISPVLHALLGVTGVILLIACANVANLLLARAAARQREIAVRQAVGAGRLRLVRQLLTESLVLALVAGAVGLLVSLWARDLLAAMIPRANVPIHIDFALNPRVLLFALGVSLATALLFGLAPAIQTTRAGFGGALKDEIGGAYGYRGRLQAALVVAQVALSLVTLVSAGLFVRSLASSGHIEAGFARPEGVLLVETDLRLAGYRDTMGIPVARRLLEAVRAVPGVVAAGLASDVPLGFGGGSSMGVSVAGYTPKAGENMSLGYFRVSGDYFRVMQTQVVRGRPITDEDRRSAPRVAVVNQTFVRRFLGDRADPIGATLDHGSGPVRIVGVVRDGKYRYLTEAPLPFVWYAYEQSFENAFVVFVRAAGRPEALVAPLRRAFAAVSPDLPFLDVRTLADDVAANVLAQRVGAWMLSGFGVLALLLSAIGIYGVMAYSVSRRVREIGVRMALGADRREVVRLVLRRSLRMVGVGLAIGTAAAAGAGAVLQSQLIGVKPWDPPTFVVILVTLSAVALLSSWLPARRAARVDPLVALRYE
jgi:putative ABC transport system permease protein